jgi:alkanesulfonate monooxygenase SsuD/methylene tetrahydromethanopterin reductase-like flavin-dependent oxidoreductase (luciferase family)
VITADTATEAQAQLQISRRGRVRRFFSRDGQPLSDDDADFILRSPQAASIDQMMKYTAVGTPEDVQQYLEDFARRADADELMVVFQGSTIDVRMHALELVAKAASLPR